MRNLTSAAAGLNQFLLRYSEWLIEYGEGSFYLLSDEIEIRASEERLHIDFLSATGISTFSFSEIQVSEARIVLASRDSEIVLIPRVLARELRSGVEVSRAQRANESALRFKKQVRGLRPVRVGLNERNGRFAEIIAQTGISYVAILADVTGNVARESLLTRAILWRRSLANSRFRVKTMWICAEVAQARELRSLIGCLRESTSEGLVVWQELAAPQVDEGGKELYFERCKALSLSELWNQQPPRLTLSEERSLSALADSVMNGGEHACDVVFNSHGETLRFHGLSFMRTRRLAGETNAWFGIERDRIRLTGDNRHEFAGLISDLRQYRRFDSPNRQHEYYRASPEAWLESLLRRNIKRLDPNLVLSPIYNQFRAEKEKIDLLALRRDGRLVIIELKVTQDRDMVFQALDYWRRVEHQRRRGKLREAKLFGDLVIADRPTLIYLAAPTLGFHHETNFFAELADPGIEIYRFDLAEDWRKNIKALKRSKI